ncbi:TFIID-18kDa-domain-containing protein [Linnemannia elongata AG-77]|uniref:TFIID-18kDa-domain-containing protein n=1 Tax=Linnemannia elongata AG-77 TaxID=1314771 RepID=A0A197K902_9FUNG|nr:TFIID-18kDa-domain-containing protein [Linnemannia elongata AG-77]
MADKDKDRDKDKSRYRYQSEIQQMMFVFGEVSDAIQETTMLVEDIVRSQVIEIICLAAQQARKRASRFMTAEDLIFLIRHDRPKVNRLRTYLSWKDVRKNVKDSSDGAGGTGADDVAGLDDAAAAHEKGGGVDGPGGGPNGKNSAAGPVPVSKARRMRVKLSWELLNGFADAMLGNGEDDEEDDDDEDAYLDSMQRLRDADRITLAMTREEYEHYSECRQASFTYRKAKRFREWANMASYIDMRPNDDIIDILGFLTFEMVTTLTEAALKVKKEEDEKQRLYREAVVAAKNKSMGKAEDGTGSGAGGDGSNGANNGAGEDMDLDEDVPGLFSLPPSEKGPLQSRHIREAFRRLQRAPLPIKNYNGGLARTKVSLI